MSGRGDEEFRATLSEEDREQYDEVYAGTTAAAFERLAAATEDLIRAVAESFPVERWRRQTERIVGNIRKRI